MPSQWPGQQTVAGLRQISLSANISAVHAQSKECKVHIKPHGLTTIPGQSCHKSAHMVHNRAGMRLMQNSTLSAGQVTHVTLKSSNLHQSHCQSSLSLTARSPIQLQTPKPPVSTQVSHSLMLQSLTRHVTLAQSSRHTEETPTVQHQGGHNSLVL